MTRLKPSRLIAARTEARRLLWDLLKHPTPQLSLQVYQWLRIEFTVWNILRKL